MDKMKLLIAREFGIPSYLAGTINISKYLDYLKYLQSTKAKTEMILDKMERERNGKIY